MKKPVICSLLFVVFFLSQTWAQSGTKQDTPPGNSGQNLLFNDLYAGYGAGSIFYFTGRMLHSDDYTTYFSTNNNVHNIVYGSPTSFGTIFLGYSRNLNRVVSMGFMFGIQNFTYTGKGTSTSTGQTQQTSHTIENNDLLLSGIARFLFAYVNKPVIRMYSGIGIGITVDFGKETLDGGPDYFSERKLWPAGQLTLMGIRFGKAFGGFFEFGFGSYGIVNAGLSYKFSD